MTMLTAFVLGFLGALLLNVVRLAELANTPKIERPPTVSDWAWWFQFLALPIVGGILTAVYAWDGAELSPILAMNVGISAPLIIKAMAAISPEVERRTD